MKTLFILRHAKAGSGNIDTADFDRALKREGLEDAAFIGSLLGENDIEPDLIISSPARRAAQTAAVVKETARFSREIRFDERIYEASPQALLQVVSEVEDKNDTVLLVGHNPGLENLIEMLTGKPQSMPTAGLAKIHLQLESWSRVAPGSGQRKSFVSPKDK